MTDDLAALAAVIGEADRAFRSPSSPEYLARVILESEWLREHDARVRAMTASMMLADVLRIDRG